MATSVLVIYTGGTIGMQPTEKGFAPATGLETCLRQGLGEEMNDVDWLEITPLIDSSNAQPSDWLRLAHLITQQWHAYQGFIILHGTDTLAYTASALSFFLGALDKPVVLTGSQIPLMQSRSDGWRNVSNSLAVAKAGTLNEVSVCFHDKVLRGNRSRKLHSQTMHAFDSPAFPALMELGISPAWNTRSSLVTELAPVMHQPLPEKINDRAVEMIMLYPGMHQRACEWLLHQPDLRGLVVLSYGAGNPPTGEDGPLNCLQTLVKQQVLVVNISQCISGGVEQGSYASGAEYNRIGVLPGGDMTPEAALTKLHWLFASGASAEHSAQLVQRSIAGELTA